MRYLAGCTLVLVGLMALPFPVSAQTGEQAPAKAALAIHAKYHLPPQFMLRASYYYNLDILDPIARAPDWDWCHEPFDCPDNEAKSAEREAKKTGPEPSSESASLPTEEQQRKQERNRRIGLGVGVAVGLALATVAGLTVALSRSLSSD